MEDEYPDPPPGWIELRERMKRAKTGEEVDQIANEMKKLLDAYEAKMRNRSVSFHRPTTPISRKEGVDMRARLLAHREGEPKRREDLIHAATRSRQSGPQ